MLNIVIEYQLPLLECEVWIVIAFLVQPLEFLRTCFAVLLQQCAEDIFKKQNDFIRLVCILSMTALKLPQD